MRHVTVVHHVYHHYQHTTPVHVAWWMWLVIGALLVAAWFAVDDR